MLVQRALASILVACVLGATGAVAAVAGDGRGLASKSPADVVAAARAAALGAHAVHVKGGGTNGGQPISFDLYLVSGAGRGHLNVNGLSFDIVRVGADAYFRGDATFWKKAAGDKFAAFAPLFAGKWMRGSATQGDLASLTGLTDSKQLFGAILAPSGNPLKNQGATTFQGKPAVAIADGKDGGTLYVAATGTPFPLGITGGGNKIVFDYWNAQLQVRRPAHSVDLSSFLKKR